MPWTQNPGSLQGPPGAPGATGATGATGAPGTPADTQTLMGVRVWSGTAWPARPACKVCTSFGPLIARDAITDQQVNDVFRRTDV